MPFSGCRRGSISRAGWSSSPRRRRCFERELTKPGYVCRPIAMGTNTDPYQPIERDHEITRSILEVLSDCGHPVSIVTKSALVLRDLDILADMAARGLGQGVPFGHHPR